MVNHLNFIFFLLAFIYLPGRYLTHKLKLKLSRLDSLTSSLLIGLVSFTILSLVLRLSTLNYEIYIYLIIGIIDGLALKQLLSKKIKLAIPLQSVVEVIILLSISASIIFFHFETGYKTNGLLVTTARDGLWRVAIIEELVKNFPPHNPGMSSEPLKNYHYLYDFIIASSHRITGINIIFLYFHYFSLLSSILFVLAINSIIGIFTKNTFIRLYGVVLTVFLANLSYLLPLISASYDFIAKPNIFMSDQPFDQGHNPFNLLAYSFMLITIFFIYQWEKNKSKYTLTLVCIFIGLLGWLKIYAGFLVISSWTAVYLYMYFKSRRFQYVALLPYLIFIPIYLHLKSTNPTVLTFAPLWILDKLVMDSDRLNLPILSAKMEVYQRAKNIPRIILIRLQELTYYLLGNLNIRVISLVWFKDILFRPLSLTLTEVYISSIIILSFAIPLLFMQSRSPFDIIQFTPYGLLLTSILTIKYLDHFYRFLENKGAKNFGKIVLIIIFALGVPTNVYLLYSRRDLQNIIISKEEVNGLEFLRDHTPGNSIIMTDLYSANTETMYVSALSGRRTLLTGIPLVSQTGINTQDLNNEIKDIYANFSCNKWRTFMASHTVSYVYLTGQSLNQSNLLRRCGDQLVYKNTKVRIYKYN